MLLLHVSDIHFRAPDCLQPELDPERAYRTRLMRDVQERAGVVGPVDAILVGGDIAFGGDPREYSVAAAWLRELQRVCGCGENRVFTVPGNHDVDRAIIRQTPAIRNVQAAIANA